MSIDQESIEMTSPSLTPRYPNIEVELTDGNVYAIIGAVTKALRRAKVSETEIAAFKAEATSGDYDHAIQTAMRWVEIS